MGFFDGGFSSILGAAGSIAGGLLGGNRSSSSSSGFDAATFWNNYNMQKEFAQNGVRWRVADAKAAGLHPLAALGAQTMSPSAAIGNPSTSSSSSDMSWLGDVGQNIGRAIDAKTTARERMHDRLYQEQTQQLDLENRKLQNDALKLDMVRQLARDAERAVNTQQQVPQMQSFSSRLDGAVIPGQSNSTTSSLYKISPPELMANHPQTPFAEAGSHPELKWSRTNDGGYAPMRSQALEEALEDDFLGSLAWNIRNRLGATFYDSDRSAPPDDYLPDRGRGEYGWTFNVGRQAYYPYKRRSFLNRLDRRFNPF